MLPHSQVPWLRSIEPPLVWMLRRADAPRPTRPSATRPVRIRDHVHRWELGVDRPKWSPCVDKDRRVTRQSDAGCPVSVPEYGVTTWVKAAVEVDRAPLRLHKRVPTQSCGDRRNGSVVGAGADLAAYPAGVDGATRCLHGERAAHIGRPDRSVGVLEHEIAIEARCVEGARCDCEISARVRRYGHIEVHPGGRREASANRHGDGDRISLLPVAGVNGIGKAAPVLSDADLASGPGLTCTLPAEWTNRSTTWLLIGKTVVPGAGWRGAPEGKFAMMSTMSTASNAPTVSSRRGRRHGGGTWAPTIAASEADDAFRRMLAMAAERTASLRRKDGRGPGLCCAPFVASLRDFVRPTLLRCSCVPLLVMVSVPGSERYAASAREGFAAAQIDLWATS